MAEREVSIFIGKLYLNYLYLFFLFLLGGSINCQSTKVIYSVSVDSTEGIGKLIETDNALLFDQFKRYPPPFTYCGNGGPIYDIVKDIYQIRNDEVSLLFKGEWAKDYADYRTVDFANVLNTGNYYHLNSMHGLFLSNPSTPFYWLYNQGKIEKIKLKDGVSLSAHPPFWYGDKFLLRGNDSTANGQLYYLSADYQQAIPFFGNESRTFRIHNQIVYDSIMLFNTYDPVSKDHNLYKSNQTGDLTKITDFPRGLYHFNQEGSIGSIIYLRFQHKGFADNYSNTYYKPTSFWKYDTQTGKLSLLKEMSDYGVTFSAVKVENSIYLLFGKHKYQVLRINEDNSIENSSSQIPEIAYFQPAGRAFQGGYLCFGVDHQGHQRIVTFDRSGNNTVSMPVDSVIKIDTFGQKLFLLTESETGQKHLLVYTGGKEIETVVEVDKDVLNIDVLGIGTKNYLLLVSIGPSSLHLFEDGKLTLLLNSITRHGDGRWGALSNVNYQPFKGAYYFVVAGNGKSRTDYIYKVE